jgi:hypothetical protein
MGGTNPFIQLIAYANGAPLRPINGGSSSGTNFREAGACEAISGTAGTAPTARPEPTRPTAKPTDQSGKSSSRLGRFATLLQQLHRLSDATIRVEQQHSAHVLLRGTHFVTQVFTHSRADSKLRCRRTTRQAHQIQRPCTWKGRSHGWISFDSTGTVRGFLNSHGKRSECQCVPRSPP